MKFAVRSDKGKVREINEDSYKIITDCPGGLHTFIVADGMGGHNSGEVASKTAVEAAAKYILNCSENLIKSQDREILLKDIIANANTVVYNKSKIKSENAGMGTTFVLALSTRNKMYIGHVGDSRAYLIRDGEIKQITTDHSYVEELVKNGSLTREEAENHPQKNLITRALGCMKETEIDTYVLDIFENDYIVLCTDGLTNMLTEDEIKNGVLKEDDLEIVCEELVRKANKNGGQDNITVIVIKN